MRKKIVIALLSFVFLFLAGVPARSDTQTKAPTNCFNDNSAGDDWGNTANAEVDDSNYSDTDPTWLALSDHLHCTGYNFSIPSGSTIDGITLKIKHQEGTGTISEEEIRIIKGGTRGTENKSTGLNWTSTITTTSFGGASDLWSETWTNSDINASDFGGSVQVDGDYFLGNEGRVYFMEMVVDYTPPATGNPGGLLLEIF